jgi:predicted alpha/beta hydrolase family esterase
MNFIILHGTGNNSQGNWFPWLKAELEKQEHQVWVPDLPNSDAPDPKLWTPYILDNVPFEIDAKTIFVGHSAGSVEALYLIQKRENPVKGAVLVGAFDNDLGWDKLSRLFPEPFDYEKIKANGGNIQFLHSEDDPHCPPEGARVLAEKLSAEMTMLDGMGHFSAFADPRFKELPEILPLIQKIVK